MTYLKLIALLGNILYILWIVYNAIDDGFNKAGMVQIISLGGLLVLLALNIIILKKQK